MGSKMFLLLVLVLPVFIEHGQGSHETHKLAVTTSSANAPVVEEPLITAVIVNRPTTTRRHRRRCNCRGEGREMVTARCLCQPLAKHSGKNRKLKVPCQQEKMKNPKKCSRFFKAKKGGKTMKMSPSVPI